MARSDVYSRIVVWVKVALPTVALMLLSTLFLLSGAPDPDAALPYTEVDVDQITREQRVTQPRFAGVLSDGRELVMVANAVAMESGQSERISAGMIEGRMDLQGQEYLTLEAEAGDFDMATQMAALRDGVTLQSSMGYLLRGETLDMALDRVEMRSATPVHVVGPGMDLTADTMEVTDQDGDAILHFAGSVRLIYEPQAE